MGGNVRVGLEDSLFIEPGRLAASNAEQVAKAVRILGEMVLTPATPDEARALLGLKGKDAVAIEANVGRLTRTGHTHRDRKNVVSGRSVSVSIELGGRR